MLHAHGDDIMFDLLAAYPADMLNLGMDLEGDLGPGIREALARTADQLREDADHLDALADVLRPVGACAPFGVVWGPRGCRLCNAVSAGAGLVGRQQRSKVGGCFESPP